jgi:hypothetical protein
MANFSASILAANMAAANTTLNNAGFGPNNFSVPAYAGPSPTVALLHSWNNPALETAVRSIAGVTVNTDGDPQVLTKSVANTKNTTWGNDAPLLTGTVSPGLYKDAAEVLWWVIQSYNTAIYPDPTVIPALIRKAKVPGEVLPWVQPLDQYDAYKLVNSFTGLPDQCTHNSFTWKVTQADGAGNNVWEPGIFGWTQI